MQQLNSSRASLAVEAQPQDVSAPSVVRGTEQGQYSDKDVDGIKVDSH